MPPRKKETAILPEATEIGRVYTTQEVAELLKVTPRTVQDWIRTGKLPAMRYGRVLRIRAEDLAKFGQAIGSRS
jgi:excisionase family DNA binding protein